MKRGWISLEELVVIHERVLQETGGATGILNPGGLEAALQRPFVSLGGRESYTTLAEKVACFVEALMRHHPFVDGNKRTALVAADVCLRLHGFSLIPSRQVEDFFWAMARGEKTLDEITAWFEQNTEPLRG